MNNVPFDLKSKLNNLLTHYPRPSEEKDLDVEPFSIDVFQKFQQQLLCAANGQGGDQDNHPDFFRPMSHLSFPGGQ